MNWHKIEAALVEYARREGWLLDQKSDSGDITVDDTGRINLTELAKELEERLR